MLGLVAIGSALLLAVGLTMRLLALEGGAEVLAVGFVVLMALPVVRLLWLLIDLARSRDWTFVLVGLLVVGLLLSTLLWPTG